MKIVLNAFQYSRNITGTDRMAFNFLTNLQEVDSKNQYFVICSTEDYTRSALQTENFKALKPIKIPGPTLFQRIYNKIWRRVLPYRLKLIGADVFLSFHNMDLPKSRVAKKMVASNLDLIPVVLNDYEGSGKFNLDDQLADYRRVTKVADIIVSISNFSKNELHRVLDVVNEKIAVVHLAADPRFGTSHNQSLAIEGKYIFTVGGSEPRKNVRTVIEAYQLLTSQLREQYKLVVAGGKWHGKSLGYEEDPNIIEIGYVPDEELPSLYANSTVFVFASVYEGFGFTILEAMAAGTPVINARGSSLDEVAGQATLTFEATNATELAEQLARALEDHELRQSLVQKGYKQTAKFSWIDAANNLHKVLTDY